MSRIQVVLDGAEVPVKNASLSRSLDAFVGVLTFTLPFTAGARLVPGAPVEAFVVDGGPSEPQFRGFVEVIGGSGGAQGGELQLDCRDQTSDILDGRPLDARWSWLEPTTLLEVAQAVAQPFGLRVEDAVEAGSLRIPRLTAQPAEAGHELLERAARLHGVLVSTTPEGAVRLGRPTLDVAGVTLRTGPGANVQSFTWRHDHSQRYRELRLIGTGDLSVLVRGTAARPGAGAMDPDIRATRTTVQVAPGDLFFDELEAYARWQVAVARARSATMTVEVPSLRTRAGGPVWRPGMLVDVQLPELDATGELLVAAVALSYDLAGERASLGLAVPDAYTVDPTLAERLRRGSPEVLVQA